MSVPFVFETLEPRGEVVAVGATPADRAAEIVAEAESRAAEIAAEARADGFAAGREEAKAAAAEELLEASEAFALVLDGLRGAREEVVAAVERQAVELALVVAEKVLGAAIDADPALVCDVVAGALRRTSEQTRFVIDLNPEDVELVRGWLESGGAAAAAGQVELRAERRVARGGCVVRTEDGEVDARISEQLDRAGEILRETFAGRES